MHPAKRRPIAVLLTVVALVAGCASSSTSPSASGQPSPFASVAPSGTPTVTPTAQPSGLSAGALAVTVSDRLRVRSQPRVSDDSLKYEPVLPLGTELLVLGGPVDASGFTWYQVSPTSFTLADGVRDGWVAMADHDGTPWIALAEGPLTGVELAKASVPRAPATTANAGRGAGSVNAFGLELYRAALADPKLELTGKNVVISPTSIALALAMARAGARGDTATEMDAVLHAKGWDDLGSGLNALEQALASRDAAWKDEENIAHELALRIANAAFAQRGWPIEPSYLDAIASAFGSGLQLLDYIADPDAARKTINAWVSRQTAKRIPELLGPGVVTDMTRLVLVNAVYLKAVWEIPFREASTQPARFTRPDGSTISVPTMELYGDQTVPYAKGTGWQATELRYLGADGSTPLAMTLILPDDIDTFERDLSSERLSKVTAALAAERMHLQQETHTGLQEDCGTYPYTVRLYMPRFGVETGPAMIEGAIMALGMKAAFDRDSADFTGITNENLYISHVVHQANIDVDEKGTEAAAATAVIMDTGGCTGPLPAIEITLRLDRPFLFAVRDLETGAILFMGRVVDPSTRN